MDIHIAYDEVLKRVQRVYLNSQFLGHGKVQDTMSEFKKANEDLHIVNYLLQLSMDSPNVNWAFLDPLEEYRKTEDPQAPVLINIDSFGFHAYMEPIRLVSKRQTELEKTLKAAYNIFKYMSYMW